MNYVQNRPLAGIESAQSAINKIANQPFELAKSMRLLLIVANSPQLNLESINAVLLHQGLAHKERINP